MYILMDPVRAATYSRFLEMEAEKENVPSLALDIGILYIELLDKILSLITTLTTTIRFSDLWSLYWCLGRLASSIRILTSFAFTIQP